MTGALFIAPFPPVFHGQAISSDHLATWLEDQGIALTRWDINERAPGLIAKLSRAARLAGAALACLTTRHRTVYLSVSANKGMWLTAVLARLARSRRRKIMLHHHTNAHLTAPRAAAAALIRSAGAEACHIVICDDMRDNLHRHYGTDLLCECLSNVGVVAPPPAPTAPLQTAPFVLGHLSNLTAEKGCLRAIETFKAAHKAGLAKRLILAGPVADPELAAQLAQEKAASEGAIDWIGPVYGADKAAFFDAIDVFLFPSLYPNETQGIVNLEALAAGRPVIAYGQCCIPSDLADPKAGAVVPPDTDFAETALAALTRFAETTDDLAAAARQRFDQLSKDATAHRTRVAEHMRTG